MFRSWKDSKGKDDRYAKIVKEQVEKSKEIAKKDGVKVPETIEEYVIKREKKPAEVDFMDADEGKPKYITEYYYL